MNGIDESEVINKVERESSSTDDDNYVIKTKICRRLSRELKLPEIFYDEIGKYEPPKEPGLENSNPIIPPYYHLHKHPSKIFNLDYLNIIKDDIKNFRPLNKYQLEYIKDLSHDYKFELISIYNECMKTFYENLNV
jgi:hypothetical protein